MLTRQHFDRQNCLCLHSSINSRAVCSSTRQCWLQLWVSCTVIRRCCDCTASSATTTNVPTRLNPLSGRPLLSTKCTSQSHDALHVGGVQVLNQCAHKTHLLSRVFQQRLGTRVLTAETAWCHHRRQVVYIHLGLCHILCCHKHLANTEININTSQCSASGDMYPGRGQM